MAVDRFFFRNNIKRLFTKLELQNIFFYFVLKYALLNKNVTYVLLYYVYTGLGLRKLWGFHMTVKSKILNIPLHSAIQEFLYVVGKVLEERFLRNVFPGEGNIQ